MAKNKKNTHNMEYIIGGIAGAGATIFSNPVDVIKTRLQLQGELKPRFRQSVLYKGIAHGFYTVIKNDGVFALQRGLAAAMIFGFTMNSVRLGLYRKADTDGWTRNEKGETVLYNAIICSGICGACGGIVGNPFSIVKTRLHSRASEKIAVGKQHKYKGTWDAFKTIYRTEGFKGYLSGINGIVIRVGIGSAGQLPAFSIAKDKLLAYGIAVDKPMVLSFLSSMVSGVIVAIIMCPLDVINTRLYNQGTGTERMYSGVLDCFAKTFKTEGLHGLYKGVIPLYLRLAPHTTCSLLIWDRLNDLLLN